MFALFFVINQEEIKFQESVVSSATRIHFEGMKAVANRSWFNLITTVPQKKQTFNHGIFVSSVHLFK